VLVFAEPRVFDSADLSARLSSWVRNDGGCADVLLERLQEAWRADRIDPTLRAFVERIDASLDNPLLVSDLAAWRRVSTSQLERQLRNALGTPARQLMIWRRLRVAFTRIIGGASLTHAALDAGFVDSAHFSRTVRRHFGVRADRVFGR
jgi:AraC-like DNA-binding protein